LRSASTLRNGTGKSKLLELPFLRYMCGKTGKGKQTIINHSVASGKHFLVEWSLKARGTFVLWPTRLRYVEERKKEGLNGTSERDEV
ncbi:unnamed protein product, partial [Urochloa humidicola]